MAINLKKGQEIDLTKKNATGSTTKINKFCVGVNWGAIDRSYTQTVKVGGFLGFGGKEERVTKRFTEAVDLDASCCMFNSNNELIDIVSYKQLRSKDGAINHSGDDTEGDMDGDDGLDNEIISVNLSAIHANTDKVVFFLNSYKKQDFATIPFASIRLYEGTPDQVSKIHATYNAASDDSFKGYVSMVLGALTKVNGDWSFKAIGSPITAPDLESTVAVIKQQYI